MQPKGLIQGHLRSQPQRRLQLLVSLAAGSLMPLSMAPLNLWPLALLSLALLGWLTLEQQRRQILELAFAFGVGLFAVGTSWVFVSIHNFGNASLFLAGALTALFVLAMALIFAMPFTLFPSTPLPQPSRHLVLFCAVWVIGEWMRSWFLTGFPWLFTGYSQLPTALSGWGPVTGIYGISLATTITASALLLTLLHGDLKSKITPLLVVAALWLSGTLLQQVRWTHPTGATQQVLLVQPNIPQEMKWLPEFRQQTLERLQNLSDNSRPGDWIIWPEAAVPLLYHRALPILSELHYKAVTNNNALITGILFDNAETQSYYNSLLGLGTATGIYHKTRLVPFGEYVPMERWLRGLIDFFNLPMSMISAGQPNQAHLQIGRHRLATAICYEIVYPDLVATNANNSAAIITVSNDAWFGHSWGPLQHLQIAQMRALETGRYLIRATNNGVSAIVTPSGKIQTASEQFEQNTTRGSIEPMGGETPFMRFGSLPVVALCVLVLLILRRLQAANNLTQPPD